MDHEKRILALEKKQQYKEAIPLVDVMYITEVDIEIENGDTFFPEFNEVDFEKKIGETLGDEIQYTRTMYYRKSR